ncbi:MAG: hypothetical protein JHC30_07965 [Caldisericum sp.]|nr:hypothetical protein [Caldisericum sp.]
MILYGNFDGKNIKKIDETSINKSAYIVQSLTGFDFMNLDRTIPIVDTIKVTRENKYEGYFPGKSKT